MSGKFPFRKTFSEFRILKTWELFGKFRVFYKTALRSSVHIIKISVKLVEIRFWKNPKMSQDVSGNPRNSGKKKCVFRFSGRRKDTAYFWNGKKFPGKSDVFGGKFPEITENPENSGIRKISEKSAKTSILENSTLVCRARFKTHILRS
jgi:hypothetical protein